MSVTVYKPPQTMGDEMEATCGSGLLIVVSMMVAAFFGWWLLGKHMPRQLHLLGPVHERLDHLTKAVQQLQALMHVEGTLTREACEFAPEFVDLRARVQALMNKLMSAHEVLEDLRATNSNLYYNVQKTMRKSTDELKNGLRGAFTKLHAQTGELPKELKEALNEAVDKCTKTTDEALAKMLEQHKKDYCEVVTFMSPLKRNQESFSTAMSGRFNDMLKELSNVAYNLTKQVNAVEGQLRWAQQALDRTQSSTEHLPDKLNFLRGLLESVKETTEGLQKEIQSMDAEKADKEEESSPKGPPTQPQTAPSNTWTGPATQGSPHVVHLEESLPLTRTGVLMPITLPNGNVVFIPRSTLQQLLGPGHI